MVNTRQWHVLYGIRIIASYIEMKRPETLKLRRSSIRGDETFQWFKIHILRVGLWQKYYDKATKLQKNNNSAIKGHALKC